MATENNEMIPVTMDDISWAIDVLVESFADEQPMLTIFDEQNRRENIACVMRVSFLYAMMLGRGLKMPDNSGLILMATPAKKTLAAKILFRLRAWPLKMRFRLHGGERFRQFSRHISEMHKQAIAEPHYHLTAMGVHHKARGTGIGAIMLKSAYTLAENENLPAYCETQKIENVKYYQKHDFKIVIEKEFTDFPGLNNWGMIRRPNIPN